VSIIFRFIVISSSLKAMLIYLMATSLVHSCKFDLFRVELPIIIFSSDADSPNLILLKIIINFK
jgi:hypothetical protein